MKIPNPSPIVSNANMANAVTSSLIIPQRNYGYSVQASWTTAGTLGGVLKLQISLDGLIWNDLENSSQTLTGNGSFTWIIQAYAVCYGYAQLVYVPAVGDSGVLNAICNL